MIELNVTEDAPIELNALSDEPVTLGVSEQIVATYADLSPELKQAFLNLAEHIAYIDADGQDYYDALEAALSPPSDLSYITAVYTQSGTVYDTDSLDSLKADLVVTAYYDDSTSKTVTAYTLSGTLTEGTSTITVSYGGKTDTFNVTVTAAPSYVSDGLIHHFDAINNTGNGHDANAATWVDLVGTDYLTPNTLSAVSWESNALVLSGNSGQQLLGNDSSTNASGKTIEVVFSTESSQTGVIVAPFYDGTNNTTKNNAYGKIVLYSDGTFGVMGKSGNTYPIGVNSISALHHICGSYSNASTVSAAYANGSSCSAGSTTHSLQRSASTMVVGASPDEMNYRFTGKIHSIRIYNRVLTAEEVASNYQIDLTRFGLV